MSETNVVALNFQSECVNNLVSWADDLREMLAQNKVAALVVRGIDIDGEPIAWSIQPDTGQTIRYVMIGMLSEAHAEMIALETEPLNEEPET